MRSLTVMLRRLAILVIVQSGGRLRLKARRYPTARSSSQTSLSPTLNSCGVRRLPTKLPDPQPREIVEEPSYKTQLAQLRISYQELDCAYERVSVAIARRPEIFPQVLDTGVHRLRINGYSRFPDLDVWFTFTESHVFLHYIELAPDDEE